MLFRAAFLKATGQFKQNNTNVLIRSASKRSLKDCLLENSSREKLKSGKFHMFD